MACTVLQDKWSAVYSVHTILVSLQSLLGDPNNASPLNVEASELWPNAEGPSASVPPDCLESPLFALSRLTLVAFKAKVAKHYRPL